MDRRGSGSGACRIAQSIASGFERRPRRSRHALPKPGELLAAAGDRIAEERARLLRGVPPEVLEVHDAVRRAEGSAIGMHESPAFYERRYLVRDALRLRAAAIAVGHANTALSFKVGDDPAARLDALEEWPALFSPTGQAYGSLRRTLARLPAEVPGRYVWALRDVRLPRTVTNAIELTAIGIAVEQRWRTGGRSLERIVLHASADEIVRAVAAVGEAVGEPLRANTPRHLLQACRYLADFPEAYGGRLEGLATRAIEWHAALSRGAAPRVERSGIAEPSADRAAVAPPFPLPEIPGVRFLAAVGEIRREGREMGHCVASRAAAAVAGEAFLFHVEHDGKHATVELARRGLVVETAGPGNRRNSAASWGARVLREWWRASAARFGEPLEPPPPPPAAVTPPAPARGPSWETAVGALAARPGGAPHWVDQLDRFRRRVAADEPPEDDRWHPDTEIVVPRSLMRGRAPGG